MQRVSSARSAAALRRHARLAEGSDAVRRTPEEPPVRWFWLSLGLLPVLVPLLLALLRGGSVAGLRCYLLG